MEKFGKWTVIKSFRPIVCLFLPISESWDAFEKPTEGRAFYMLGNAFTTPL